MEIKITIEGLDQLTESLALIGSALAYQKGMAPTAKAAVALMNGVTETPLEVPTIEKQKKAVEETKVEVAEGPPAITIEQLREVFMKKNNTKGNTTKLKGILTQFGVKKVTDLAGREDAFPAVLKALEDI